MALEDPNASLIKSGGVTFYMENLLERAWSPYM
jgi:hypothetical protein